MLTRAQWWTLIATLRAAVMISLVADINTDLDPAIDLLRLDGIELYAFLDCLGWHAIIVAYVLVTRCTA